MISQLIFLRKSLTHNAVLKIMSLLIGYGLWDSISSSHTKNIQLTIPLCFYGSYPADTIINAPESICVHLAGKRGVLQTIHLDALALHINAAELHAGTNALTADTHNLFLPNSVSVLDYTPTPIVISVVPTNAQTLSTEPIL